MKTEIVYWPKGGSVEKNALLIAEKTNSTAYCIADFDIKKIKDLDLLILGSSTVGADDWKNPSYKDAWVRFFEEAKEDADAIKDKKIAIFGLGNQILYPNHFVDSIKNIADYASAAGAQLVGLTEDKGYSYQNSEAVVDGKFLGLALDEDTEADLSEGRIDGWLKEIL